MPTAFLSASWRLLSLKPVLAFCGLLLWSVLAPHSAFAGPYDDLLKKGRDHFGLFQFNDARDCFQKAVELDGKRSEGYFHLGNTLRKLNDNTGALSAYEKAHSIDSDETDCKKALAGLYFQLAREARSSNNKSQMLDSLKKAVTVYPQNTQAAASLMDLLAKDSAWDQILTMGDLLKRSNRDALDAGDDKALQASLVIAARAAIERKEFSRAREFLHAAGMIRHPNEELNRMLKGLPATSKTASVSLVSEGRDLLEQRKYKLALEKLKQAQEAEPSNAELEGLLAEAQRKVSVEDFLQAAAEAEKGNNFEEALEHLNRAIGMDEENLALRKRAEELTKRYEKAQAEQARKKNLDLQKRQAAVEQNKKLAVLLKAAKENESKQAFDAALTNFQQALVMAPDDEEIKGAVERVKGLAGDAQERRSRLGQNLRKANEHIGRGEYDQAYGLLKEASEDSYAPPAEVFPALIECLLKLDKIDEAETAGQRLAKIASGSSDVLFAQGVIAYRRQNFSAAGEALAKVSPKSAAQAAEITQMIWMIRWNKYKYGIIICLLFIGWKIFSWLHGLFGSFLKGRAESKIERLLASGKYDQVVPLLEGRLNSGDALSNRRQVLLSLSDAYLRTNRPHEAKDKAAEILSKDPRNAMALRIIGEACFQMGDVSPDGMERILALYKTDENRKDLLQFLINQYKSVKADSKTALDLLHKQVAINADDTDTVIYLAGIYQRRSLFNQQSLKMFERAAKLDPDTPDWIQAQALSHQQAGRREEYDRLMAVGAEKWPGHPLFTQYDEPAPQAAPQPAERPKISLMAPGEDPSSSSSRQRSTPAATPSRQAAPAGTAGVVDGQVCQSCGAANSNREYYCTTCGKPLK